MVSLGCRAGLSAGVGRKINFLLSRMKTIHINRNKFKNPKKGSAYCYGCDSGWIITGVKCEVCGHVDGKKKRYKKQPPTIEEFD